jgi:hypothetical protein
MRPEAMLVPVCVLALWTMGVALLVGVRRVVAGRDGRLPPRAFEFGEAPGVPADLVLANRNFMNLLEAPVLFYVAALAYYVTRHVAAWPCALAWIYVGLRVAHSIVHLTSNRVPQRAIAFALSNFVLATMWLSLLRRVI